MEAAGSPETSATIYQTAQCHIPEDSYLLNVIQFCVPKEQQLRNLGVSEGN
jgi:hypothetical protein